MAPLNAFDRAVAALHRAALDDTYWPAAAAVIEEAVGAVGNALVVGEGTGDDERVHVARYLRRGEPRQDLAREYFDVHYPNDAVVHHHMARPDGGLVDIPNL